MTVIEKLSKFLVMELENELTKYVDEVMKYIRKGTKDKGVIIMNSKPALSNGLPLLINIKTN
jgi:hypothetical protein